MTLASSGSGPSIAVLDDDIRYLRMVERILGLAGSNVQPVTTPDVADALRVIIESRCDAALIDVYMYGDALGFQLVEQLRADPLTARLPVVVASGDHRAIARKVDLLLSHRCVVLLKPFEPDELLRKLDDARTLAVCDAPEPGPRRTHVQIALQQISASIHSGLL